MVSEAAQRAVCRAVFSPPRFVYIFRRVFHIGRSRFPHRFFQITQLFLPSSFADFELRCGFLPLHYARSVPARRTPVPSFRPVPDLLFLYRVLQFMEERSNAVTVQLFLVKMLSVFQPHYNPRHMIYPIISPRNLPQPRWLTSSYSSGAPDNPQGGRPFRPRRRPGAALRRGRLSPHPRAAAAIQPLTRCGFAPYRLRSPGFQLLRVQSAPRPWRAQAGISPPQRFPPA